MSTTELARPTPRVVTPSGRPEFYPPEVAAYRKARGITQAQVAHVMKVTQALIHHYENAEGRPVKRVPVVAMLDAIDRIVTRREKLMSQGLAELDSIRAGSKASAGQ